MTVDKTSVSEQDEQITLFRASFAQQRMWFHNRLDPGSHYYNIPIVLSLHGPVRHDALRLALTKLIARHEILRTTFAEIDGGLMQVVARNATVDMSNTTVEVPATESIPVERHPAVQAAVLDLVRAPFDLSTGPLLRAGILDLSGGDHLFVLVMHHIITDGWSIGVVCDELGTLYAAEVTGVPAELPPLALHIGDIAEQEHDRLSGPVREQHIAYWRSRLAGVPTAPELPFDRDRPEHSTFHGAELDFVVTPSDTDAMTAFARQMNATTFMTLLAVFYVLLHRYSGSDDQVVAVPMANREDNRTTRLIGLFVNTIPLRARINPDAGFVELIDHVRELSSSAYEHRELPLEQIVDEVAPARLPGRNPLVSVLFAVQAPPPVDLDFAGIRASFVGIATDVTRADLEMHFWPHADQLAAQFVYSTELFDTATIEQLRDNYIALLRAAIAAPHAPIHRLPMGGAETARIANLRQLRTYDDSSIAIVGVGRAITHAELRETAASAAATMSGARDGVVALALERGADLVEALVAAVSAGARHIVWTPPSLPAPYRERSLRELRPTLVVDSAHMWAARASGADTTLAVDATPGRLDNGLAVILLALLHTGTVDPDHPTPAPEVVLTADHRLAPPGVLGELCVGRSQEGVVTTGVAARVRRDSSVVVAHSAGSRGRVWDGYRWADPATAEAVLVKVGPIDDCVILPRRNIFGTTELIAYVATTSPVATNRLQEAAREALPAPLVPRAFVPLATVPMTVTGTLDIAALHRLPVVDDEVIAQWSAQLPDDTRTRVVPAVAEVAHIHVGDIRTPPVDDDATPQSAVDDDATPRSTDPAELAVLDGGPEIIPAVASLPAALMRAAYESPMTELTFLDESGEEKTTTYAGLLEAAQRVLGGLRESGLVAGDSAIVHLARNDEFVAAIWGCFLGGIVPVPVDANSAAAVDKVTAAWTMLDHPPIIEGSGVHPVRCTTGAMAIGDLSAHTPNTEHHEPDSDDLALLLLTSGSTGRPKAVMLTHRNILARSAATAQFTGADRTDISFNWMPLDHVGGIVMFHLRDVYLCCRQIHASTSWVLADPLRWPAVADRHRVTNTWAPNFAFGLAADRLDEAAETKNFDVTRLRFILNAGEAIVPRTARRFLRSLERFGLPQTAMRPAWGMSETSSAVTYSERFTLETTTDSDEFTESGAPIPGTRLRIVDAAGAVLPVGETGRVQVAGPTVTGGYYRDPERTRETLAPDGWFDTGDLGRIRAGALTLTGRVKETVVVNGVNYSCHAIESAVEESPFVARSYTAAVAVRPPGRDTDALAIFFSLRTGVAPDDAFADVRSRVLVAGPNPDFLVPVLPDTIPKTNIGKVRRNELRQRFAAGEFVDIARMGEKDTATMNTIPNWFYRPAWYRRDHLRPPATVDGGVVLLGEPGELGTRLVEELSSQKVNVVSATTAELTGDLGPLLVNTTIRTIVYVVPRREPDESDPSGFLSPGFIDILTVLRGLPSGGQAIALHVVCCMVQPVINTDEVDHLLAPITALLRTAAAEIPGLRVKFIDLDARDPATDARRVADELSDTAKDLEVAYRDEARWVKGLQRLPDKPASTVGITPGALHLISGGLGGIAYELARLLVERFAGKILLIGRHDPDDRQLEVLRQLHAIAGDDTVRFERADVRDVDRIWQTVAEMESAGRARLAGIWHLAGEYREQPLATVDNRELAEVSAAKAVGIRALHRIALRRPGVRFVSFSSVNGFFGGAMVGGYAAANAYLDAFTYYQRRTCGIDARSVAWTMWDRTGMSARSGQPEIARAMGFHVLGRAEALDSLMVALSHDEPHVLVGLDRAIPAIRAHLLREHPTGRMLTAELSEIEPHNNSHLVHDRYGVVVPTRVESNVTARRRVSARDDTEQRVFAIWRQVLGFENFGVTDSFFDLGGNSVLLARVHGRIQEEFGQSVALIDLFRYPTVSGLAAYLSSTRPDVALDTGHPPTGEGSRRAQARRDARRNTHSARR